MYPNKLYKIGKKLGMNKKDINIVVINKPNQTIDLKTSSPMDSYKGMPGRYGTLSIKYIQLITFKKTCSYFSIP